MAKLKTKEREKYYFEKFRQFAADAPDGTAVFGDKPDVIVYGERKIGIEMTSFFLEAGSISESEQKQKPYRKWIVEEAHKIYLAGGGRNIEISVSFDKINPISNNEKKNIAARLTEVVKMVDGDVCGGVVYRHLFQEKIPELRSIGVNSKEYKDPKWHILESHAPNLMSKEKLEAIVREKEDKAKQYENCDALWLLITMDPINSAQEQEIRVDDIYIYSQIFERVIVFDTLNGHIIECNLP